MRCSCEQMVEDLRLDRLVFFPLSSFGEYIDLNGQAGLCRRQTADKKGQAFVNNIFAIAQIGFDIYSEQLGIGHLRAVEGRVVMVLVFFLLICDLFHLLLKIIVDSIDLR